MCLLVTEGNLTAVRILSASRNDFNANEIRALPERVLTEQTGSGSKEHLLLRCKFLQSIISNT